MIYLVLFSIVLLGGFIAYRFNNLDKQYVKLLLSFSGAYILSIIVFHLLPGIYAHIPGKEAGFFIMAGIIFQLVLELFSHGAEHGHKHSLGNKTPLLVFASLSIHAFMEGLPIHQGHHVNHSYFYAILIHKLPVAIVLTTVMIEVGMNRAKIFFYLIFFAAMSPLAAFLGDKLEFLAHYAPYINSFVVGILAHIGTTILFENEHTHSFNLRKFFLIISAMLIAYFT